MKLLAKIVTTIVFNLFYKIEYVNVEKVPVKGPTLLCANHRTMLDMFFLGFKLKRWVHWMAKEELFRNPVAGFIFKKLGVFPIKRGKGDVGSIKTTYRLLQEGKMVGIFPYGTRIKADNKNTARVKSGAAMIAINSGAQIVPAAVQGNYKLFSKMRVIYGDPFKLDVSEDKKYTKEELAEYSKLIMNNIDSLLEE